MAFLRGDLGQPAQFVTCVRSSAPLPHAPRLKGGAQTLLKQAQYCMFVFLQCQEGIMRRAMIMLA